MNGGGRGGKTVVTTVVTTTHHGYDSREENDAAVVKAKRGPDSATGASAAAVAADAAEIPPNARAKRPRKANKVWAQVGLVEPKPGLILKTRVMQLTHQAEVGTGQTYTNNADGARLQYYTCAVGGRCCPWMARTCTPTAGEIVVEVSGEHIHVEKKTQGVTLKP
jgi:hypothetical protein